MLIKGDKMMNSTELHQKGWNLDNSYSNLPETFFTKQEPEAVKAPKVIKLNHELAKALGFHPEDLEKQDSVEVFAGNRLPNGSVPLAQAYVGHQFGHPNMLGDGRAILLGEQVTPEGKRVDIQLKGAGRTPYSRGGDGRAALGPMLREYIISEAMHALTIPTTRSLAVVATGESIVRETELPGAVLTRVAASHLRVGTFQYGANFSTVEELKELADYTIQRHFPHIKDDENPYLSLLNEVVKRQAALLAKWQLVGFIHGVMNTDNMTISGETIDYGPCAFMNEYDPKTVFSSIDTQGRYAYGNQPKIAGWNLARFAEALLPLFGEEKEEALKVAQEAVLRFPPQYEENWLTGMRAKLGIINEEEQDEVLIKDLLQLMENHQVDYTNTFLSLTYDHVTESELFETKDFKEWHQKWHERLSRQKDSMEASKELMRRHNPVVIPRNHRVEEAIEAAVQKDDYSVMEKLLAVLSSPFELTPDKEEYCHTPPDSDEPYQTFCGT